MSTETPSWLSNTHTHHDLTINSGVSGGGLWVLKHPAHADPKKKEEEKKKKKERKERKKEKEKEKERKEANDNKNIWAPPYPR